MKKLFVTDLDGTLIDENKIVSQENIDSIIKLQEAGYTVAVATGRDPNSISPIYNQIPITTPFIGCNGSCIVENNKVIFQDALKQASQERIFQYIFDNKLPFLACTIDNTYYHFTTPMIEVKNDYMKQIKYVDFKQAIALENVLKIIIIVENFIDKKPQITNDLREDDTINVLQSDRILIAIMNKGVDKFHAIEKLMQLHNFNYLVTIGDNENDKLMIEKANIGIAMGNAEPCVKESADFITTHANNHGFSKAVEKILKGEKNEF